MGRSRGGQKGGGANYRNVRRWGRDREDCDDLIMRKHRTEVYMLIQGAGYFDTIFDIRWIWTANIFQFIGGGSAVVRSMLFTIIADVVPEENR